MWMLDGNLSTATFKAKSLLGLKRVHGEMPISVGTITVTDIVAMIRVGAILDPAGITTGNQKRDAHLRNVSLDTVNYPQMSFRAQGVAPTNDGRWRVDGDLTIRGNTVPIKLEVRLLNLFDGSVQLTATGTLRRRQFGVIGKRRLVRDKVEIRITARLRRSSAEYPQAGGLAG
jgi:polyisoprenoid-binding protein YceI